MYKYCIVQFIRLKQILILKVARVKFKKKKIRAGVYQNISKQVDN